MAKESCATVFGTVSFAGVTCDIAKNGADKMQQLSNVKYNFINHDFTKRTASNKAEFGP